MIDPKSAGTNDSGLKKVMGVGGAIFTLAFMACLTAPNEPDDSNVQCLDGQQRFNGVCRLDCTSNEGCTDGQSCMYIGASSNVCLDYQHCAYLGDDTSCVGAGGGGYGGNGSATAYGGYGYSGYGYGDDNGSDNSYGYSTGYGYGSDDPYFMAGPYSYGESGGSYQGQACVGNATWTLIPATGDPECGVKHAVNRCRPTSNGCAIISGTTTDIAEQ